jgi:hypothetical protein
MTRSVVVGVTQLAGGAIALAGLFLLTGLAWSLLATGLVIVTVSVLFEIAGNRRVAPPAAPGRAFGPLDGP